MSQVYLTPCSLYVSSDIKWDEMNILQTLHPPDKDYGFMKIDEPKTPFSYTEVEGASGTEGSSSTIKPVVQTLDPEAVIQKIQAKERRLSIDDSAALGHSVDEDEDEENLTEEEKHKRREFETKRKSHYNEFQVRFLSSSILVSDYIENDSAEMESTILPYFAFKEAFHVSKIQENRGGTFESTSMLDDIQCVTQFLVLFHDSGC